MANHLPELQEEILKLTAICQPGRQHYLQIILLFVNSIKRFAKVSWHIHGQKQAMFLLSDFLHFVPANNAVGLKLLL